MKPLYTVLLSFCTLAASAGLRITDKNSVQAESLTFATQFLQQNWQPVNITGQNFFPNDESRKHRTDSCCPENGSFPAENCI